MAAGDLLGEHADALVVEGREAAQERVQHAPERPHVHALAVPLVLHDLGRGVAHGAARGHRLLVPDNLAEPKVGDLDAPDAAATDAGDELALVLLLFIQLAHRRVRGRHQWDVLEQQVLRLDVAMHDPALLMQVPDALRHLQDDVPRQVLAEVRQLHDLVEQLAALEHCTRGRGTGSMSISVDDATRTYVRG